MLKQLVIFLLLPTICLGADKAKVAPKTDAQKYAESLSAYLTKVSAQIAKKIKAEEQYYSASADAYLVHYGDDLLETLTLERRETGEELADEIIRKKAAPDVTSLRKKMLDQSRSDIASIRKFTADERVLRDSYLAAIAEDKTAGAKIEALIKALDILSEPKSNWDDIKELGGYVGQVHSAYTTLKCEDAKKELEDLAKKKKAIESIAKPTDADKVKLSGITQQLETVQKFADDNCKATTDTAGGTSK